MIDIYLNYDLLPSKSHKPIHKITNHPDKYTYVQNANIDLN